jgi:hypothetical protein
MKQNLNRGILLFLQVVKQLIKKINDPVLLLALGESAVIGLIAIENPVFPESAGYSLIGIFLIASVYYLVIKFLRITKSRRKTK